MNYLNNIGAFKASINQIILKEAGAKNKPAIYVEFKDTLGRICSMRFNKPMNEYDWGKAAKLLSLFKGPVTGEACKKYGEAAIVKGFQGLIGKEVVIYVDVMEYAGKNFFQVMKVIDVKHADFIEGASNDPFNNDDPFDNSDPIGAALETFQGSTIKDEEIPF